MTRVRVSCMYVCVCVSVSQHVLDEVSITLNKNSVPGDKSAIIPGGIRVGTPALTTRGFKEQDFVKVADFLHRAVQVREAALTHAHTHWRHTDRHTLRVTHTHAQICQMPRCRVRARGVRPWKARL